MKQYEAILLEGDSLQLMRNIPDDSIDLILCDPPYGTIKNLKLGSWHEEDTAWDNTLPTDNLFEHLLRVARHNGKVVLFCQEPYTSELISHGNSYMQFCSKGIWLKDSYANYLGVNKAMVNFYEEFCLFRANKMKPSDANAQFPELLDLVKSVGFDQFAKLMFKEGRYKNLLSARRALFKKSSTTNLTSGNFFDEKMYRFLESQIQMPYTWEEYNKKVQIVKAKTKSTFNLWEGKRYKSSVLSYPKDKKKYHPTQKPVALLEDLIKTYSNECDRVLDFTMGSGSTGVAAVNTNREFIGIELNETYFGIAEKRIKEALTERNSDLFRQ